MIAEKSEAAKGWEALKKADRIDTAISVKNLVYIFAGRYYYVYKTPNQWSRRIGLNPIKIDLVSSIFPQKITMSDLSLYSDGSGYYAVTDSGFYQKVDLTFNNEGVISKGILGAMKAPKGYIPKPTNAALSYFKTTSHDVDNTPPLQNVKGSSVLFHNSTKQCSFTKDFSIQLDSASAFQLVPPYSDTIDAALTIDETIGISANPLDFKRVFLFSGKYQVVMTNEKTISEQDLAFWVPRLSSNNTQSQWLECSKCSAIVDSNNGTDGCSEGGAHDFTGSPFNIPFNVPLNNPYINGDIYWKRCERCHVLSRPGKCTKGGYHIYSNQSNYNLTPSSSSAYTMCDKCGGMINFGAESNRNKACPGGGLHKPVTWGAYEMQSIKGNNWKRILRDKYEGYTLFDGEKAKAFQSIESQFKELYPNPGTIRGCYLPDSQTVTHDVLEFIDKMAKKPEVIPQTDWDYVLNQLRIEIGKVDNLNAFFDKIQLNVLTVTVLDGNDLDNILNMLQAEVDPKDPPEVNPRSFLFGLLEAVLGGIPGVGEAAKEAIEFTKMVVEIIGESIELATELNEHEETPGENNFLLNAAKLKEDLNEKFKGLKKYVTNAHTIITSRWGTLNAAHNVLMETKGSDSIFTDIAIMEKAYRIQALKVLLPLKFGIINIHENEFTYGQYDHKGYSQEDAARTFDALINSEELEHAISILPNIGVSLFVKKELFKKNEIGFDASPNEAFLQYFPSKGLMEWLTGEGEGQFGINKTALIQGMMGWEGIESRKGLCVPQQHYYMDHHFFIQFGAHYAYNGRPYDPVEDLSSWKLY